MQVCTMCVSASRVTSLSAVFGSFCREVAYTSAVQNVSPYMLLSHGHCQPFLLHCAYITFCEFLFGSFRLALNPPSPSQKVSKRFRAMCWGLNFARCRSYSTCVPMAIYCCMIRLRLALWNGAWAHKPFTNWICLLYSVVGTSLSHPPPPL